jgi:hypothetical protein
MGRRGFEPPAGLTSVEGFSVEGFLVSGGAGGGGAGVGRGCTAAIGFGGAGGGRGGAAGRTVGTFEASAISIDSSCSHASVRSALR